MLIHPPHQCHHLRLDKRRENEVRGGQHHALRLTRHDRCAPTLQPSASCLHLHLYYRENMQQLMIYLRHLVAHFHPRTVLEHPIQSNPKGGPTHRASAPHRRPLPFPLTHNTSVLDSISPLLSLLPDPPCVCVWVFNGGF